MGTTLDCNPPGTDVLSRLVSPARNRYYYSKLLDTEHLELEQLYGNMKRWMLNRLTLGSGVLCGLEVLLSADKMSVRVRPGVAVDGLGREIIVPLLSPPVDPLHPTDACGRPAGDPIRGQRATLYICYLECEAEPAQVMVSTCSDDNQCENGIVRERYRLRIAAGVPPRQGLTGKQCVSIFDGPTGDARRRALCAVLDASCSIPDEVCVPLATLTVDGNGSITDVETCLSRRTVYSNAMLLELILCLAERVDRCCGETPPPTETRALEMVSGDGQIAAPNTAVANPLVARVTDGVNPVDNEIVTFTVAAGGGLIGAGGAPGAAPVQITSATDGTAALPVWQLGASGSQVVTASIASGSPNSVNFKARVRRVEVQLPVVRAIWPPNNTALSQLDPALVQAWQRRPRIEVTFSEQMRAAQLGAPEPWLRIVEVSKEFHAAPAGGGGSVLTRVRRLAYGYAGPVAAPQLGAVVAGYFTEGYKMELLPDVENAVYLVMIRSASAAIVAAATPIRQLDADFAGTMLTSVDADALWDAGAPTAPPVTTLAGTVFDALVTGPGTLPSGNGTEGGDFQSVIRL